MVRTIVDPEEQIAVEVHTKEYVEEIERFISKGQREAKTGDIIDRT